MIQIVGVVFVIGALLGLLGGWEWRDGVHAKAELRIQQERARALKAMEEQQDAVSLAYANRVSELAQNLGDTRVKLNSLTSGRPCLSAGAVGVLNAIGSAVPVHSAASQPASAANASATDRDVADALAICRGGYARLSEQVNSILDIEDARHRPAGGVAAVRESFRVSQPPAEPRP